MPACASGTRTPKAAKSAVTTSATSWTGSSGGPSRTSRARERPRDPGSVEQRVTAMRDRAGHQRAGHWLGLIPLMTTILLGALSPDRAWAQDALPTEPILRIATDRHTAIIKRVATDAQNRF